MLHLNLSNLFATWGKAPLTIDPKQCLPLRYPRSHCRLCIEGCPVDSIKIGEESIEVADTRCTACGICAVVCPSGVFSMKEKEFLKVVKELDRLLNDSSSTECAGVLLPFEGKELVLECNKVPFHRSAFEKGMVIRIPCLGYISAGLVLGLLSLGAEGIKVRDPSICNLCESKKGVVHTRALIDSMYGMLKSLGLDERIEIDSQPLQKEDLVFEGDRLKSYVMEEEINRREFFSFFKKKTLEGASSILPEESADDSEAFKRRELPHIVPTERKRLLKALHTISVVKRDSHFTSPIFADISIKEGCNSCNLCTIFCPTGAIYKGEESDSEWIDFNPSICTVCGVCEEVCPKKVITIDNKVSIGEILHNTDKRLISFDKVSCRLCNKAFVRLEPDEDLCLVCRKEDSIPFFR